MESTFEPVYFLLVDDLEENLIALEALLKRDNLVLLKAKNGLDALELLLQYDIALALLDVQMPGMDGYELAEHMRGMERTKHIPIVFLTAAASDHNRQFRGYDAGAVAFLQKPLNPHLLKNKANVFYELRRQQQEITHLLEESRQYAEALKAADRRKDEFLATLAHELRNPLAPIKNGIQLLKLDFERGNGRSLVSMMDRQLKHVIHLIDDLLDMSRVSQGKIDLDKQTINLVDAINIATEASEPLIKERAHQLSTQLPTQPVWIYADLTRIAQIISNLLNNAAKYTPQGGTLALHATAEDGEAVISVRDNGLGIEKEMLSNIFELFTQVDSSLKRSEGGLGIGLALVKHLVAMHDGTIHADSEGLDKGTVFTLRLPLAEAPTSATSGEAAEEENTSDILNVLVVDDNHPSGQTVGWMLEAMGHHYTLAASGAEAITLAQRINPDVILLDIGLPDKTGYEVCEELRRDPRFAKTLFIAQTGWGQEKDRAQAKAAGFDHHLVKPVDMDKLNKLLEKKSG